MVGSLRTSPSSRDPSAPYQTSPPRSARLRQLGSQPVHIRLEPRPVGVHLGMAIGHGSQFIEHHGVHPGFLVAVGAGVTSRPPRRSRRAAFPHRAPVEGRTRPAFGAWAAHPVPVRGLRPSGTCQFRHCVRGMRWSLPFLRPTAFPPRSPPPACRPVLFEASSVLYGRPTPHTFRSGFGSSPFRTGPGSPWRLRAA